MSPVPRSPRVRRCGGVIRRRIARSCIEGCPDEGTVPRGPGPRREAWLARARDFSTIYGGAEKGGLEPPPPYGERFLSSTNECSRTFVRVRSSTKIRPSAGYAFA